MSRQIVCCGVRRAGLLRMENIQQLLDDVIMNKVPGDFVECGVWRGGASLFARAVFAARGVSDRKVLTHKTWNGVV